MKKTKALPPMNKMIHMRLKITPLRNQMRNICLMKVSNTFTLIIKDYSYLGNLQN